MLVRWWSRGLGFGKLMAALGVIVSVSDVIIPRRQEPLSVIVVQSVKTYVWAGTEELCYPI